MIRIIESKKAGTLLKRRAARMAEAEETVRPILEAVRKRGDRALIAYARRLDGLDGESVRVPARELRRAAQKLPRELREAVETAAANIRAFAKMQLPRNTSCELAPGLALGQIVRPLDAVAAYIPSGRYPLPSTVMMTVIPAQAAGVPRICVASPRPAPAIYGVASTLGATDVFRMGGAHAIAAFAFGTATVPKVDRIVGPGNIYVAAAKKLLAGEVGIDFVAGPTEVLIIAESGSPRHLAADMLAQAEHDEDASAVLLTTSRPLAQEVALEIERQLRDLPTAPVASKSIARNSAIVVVRSTDEAVELANDFAPEHLMVPDESLVREVRHAGSVFVGPYSTEAAGDYASGTNHVLPTGGAARLRGGLSAADFVKVISVQQLSREALARLKPAITTLARVEGLEAHARAVEVRTDER
jgi:histidinol dehydrogenase